MIYVVYVWYITCTHIIHWYIRSFEANICINIYMNYDIENGRYKFTEDVWEENKEELMKEGSLWMWRWESARGSKREARISCKSMESGSTWAARLTLPYPILYLLRPLPCTSLAFSSSVEFQALAITWMGRYSCHVCYGWKYHIWYIDVGNGVFLVPLLFPFVFLTHSPAIL